jgi:serine protease AprX
MKSFPHAGFRAAPVLRAVFPFLILLMVLSGCTTSDSALGKSTMRSGSPADATSFWVNLRSRPRLQGAPAISDYAARGQFVVDELRRNAAASQGPVISLLEQRNVKFEAFWIANTIWVEADDETRKLIAALPEVESIEPDQVIALDPPEIGSSAHQATTDASGLTIEQNVSRVHAPEVWDMGADGTGIVVGVIDTGFVPHPAITSKFRGYKNTGSTFNNPYNWFDAADDPASSACFRAPCDDNGHGTHVTGTILGRDGDHAIGVAPGAQFIACRALRNGFGSAKSVVSCLQWFLAPTDLSGNNANPALRPQIVSASLGGGSDMTGLSEALGSLQAAGTLSVSAAGNSGACKTVSYPAALNYGLAVGALTADATTNTLSNYSSSGPIPNSSLIKPDVVAQGDSVTSAWLNNGYKTINGTSMATPAVSGVAALVMSARPQWIGHPADVAELLRVTANRDVSAPKRPTCNAGYPNMASGWGLVDAEAAVIKAEEPPARRQ